ncbi:hypothetical protein B0H15DRAFT_784283, partial [Mycena belliarum]
SVLRAIRENLITFDDEVDHIWSVFLFLRYFPLAVQLCNRIIDEEIQHLGHSALRAWYISQVILSHLSMTAVEVVMMVRVYALYHNDRWVGWGFVCLLFAETVRALQSECTGLFITLPGVHFAPQRFLTNVPHSFTYLGVAALVSQAIILVLTVHRFCRGQWAGTSLGNLLIRDGSVAYLVFLVTTGTAVVYSANGLAFGMTEYAWMLSIISSVGCRLILDMQRLPSSRVSETDATSDFELTTVQHELSV